MRDKDQIKSTIQELLNVVSDSMNWEMEAFTRAQKLGLQGEKRRNRYECSKNLDLLNSLKCFSFDLFGWTLKPEQREITIVPTGDFSTYFSVYHKKITTVYESMHDLANKLVQLNMQPLSCRVYRKLDCIMKDIIDTNRTIMEGEKTGWSPEFMFLHQTTVENVHDEYEKKEKGNGYEY